MHFIVFEGIKFKLNMWVKVKKQEKPWKIKLFKQQTESLKNFYSSS